MATKEVDFYTHCATCKYETQPENDEPCCWCLEDGWNEDSHKPTKWVEKDESGKGNKAR